MFSVSPLEFRFSLDDSFADDFDHTFSITNLSDSPLSFNIYAAPPPNLSDSAFGHLASWITLSDSTSTLAPGETKTFSFSISTSSLPPLSGGQYANLYVESLPPNATHSSESGIILASRIAIPLYGIVDSQENHYKAGLSSFGLSPNFTFSNLNAFTSLNNAGNIDFSTSASFSVSSIFGKRLYETSSFVNILPSEQKTLFFEWANTPPLGFYRLDYTLNAADLDVSMSRVVAVASPLALAISILLILSCIFLAYTRFSRKTQS